jgi:hypothetical protein
MSQAMRQIAKYQSRLSLMQAGAIPRKLAFQIFIVKTPVNPEFCSTNYILHIEARRRIRPRSRLMVIWVTLHY